MAKSAFSMDCDLIVALKDAIDRALGEYMTTPNLNILLIHDLISAIDRANKLVISIQSSSFKTSPEDMNRIDDLDLLITTLRHTINRLRECKEVLI